jgi:hypothetical protein
MTFRFWEVETGTIRRQFFINGHSRSDKHHPGEPTRILATVLSPDTSTAVTSGLWDDRLLVWKLISGMDDTKAVVWDVSAAYVDVQPPRH